MKGMTIQICVRATQHAHVCVDVLSFIVEKLIERVANFIERYLRTTRPTIVESKGRTIVQDVN